MTHEENEPLSNLKTADKVHHIEVEDNCNNSSSSQPKFGSNNGDDYLLKKGERIQDKADEVSRNKTVEEDFVKPILFPGSSRIQDESGKLPDCTVGQVLSFMKKKSRPTATVEAGRKLAFLPSNAKPPKIPKVNKIAAGGEARNTEDHIAEGNKENKEKEIYCFDVTRGMKCKFKPNPKMGLKSEEIQAAAFIFSAELDPGEELLKIGDVTATRKDFESLCPTQQISEKILYLTALKCVHNQTLLTWKNVWQLPPTFADTILDGNNLDEILVPMVKQFMQPTKDLQFIYIPMRENEHRYLMVISIHDSIIWQLDSYLEDDDIQRRRTKMTTVAATVEHILKSDIYNECKLEMKETCGDGEFMLQEESLIDIKCIITFTKYKMDSVILHHGFFNG
ncbi:hypothetical protein HN51_012539 [Arachis hypogaea]|uniref:uncharacterized protein isoform X1 n=1 Tax=Arachis hypogaea TaxID=3818 RepID=UPI0010FC45A0|nr:uncharacterized protein LOC112790840 isoform X2 [Arachis hypogaea]